MQAEKAVLGTIMKENYLLDDLPIRDEHFENDLHRKIYESMKQLRSQGQSIDMVTLMSYYDARQFGGANYLMEIQGLANPQKADHYAKAMVDAYRDREKQRIVSTAALERWPLEQILAELDQLQEDNLEDHHSIMDLAVEVAESPWIEQTEKRGVTTELRDLNGMTYGLQDAELTIVAARPSMGKSDVMLHLAKQAGWSGHLPIIFSLEMSARSLRDRLIASTGGYNRMKMRNPHKGLAEAQKTMWAPTLQRMADTRLQIFDKSGQTLAEMRSKVRKLVSQNKGMKPVIFVDYLTLIRPADPRQNMHLQVSEISKGLKALAKEFNCPVVALAQLSRSVEARTDKRPMLSDLRESGSIEEDADVVIFLYRDAYYTKDEQNRDLELIVAKNRNGPTGMALARYNKHTGEIEDA